MYYKYVDKQKQTFHLLD